MTHFNDISADGIRIERAGAAQVDDLATLFQQYRTLSVSYDGRGTHADAKAWITDRMAGDAVFFLAYADEHAVGFATLYPGFSSISLQRFWILNDLYVHDSCRGKGLGTALMNAVHDFAKTSGAKGIELETAHANVKAQALYESLGYRENALYKRYFRRSA